MTCNTLLRGFTAAVYCGGENNISRLLQSDAAIAPQSHHNFGSEDFLRYLDLLTAVSALSVDTAPEGPSAPAKMTTFQGVPDLALVRVLLDLGDLKAIIVAASCCKALWRVRHQVRCRCKLRQAVCLASDHTLRRKLQADICSHTTEVTLSNNLAAQALAQLRSASVACTGSRLDNANEGNDSMSNALCKCLKLQVRPTLGLAAALPILQIF